MGGICVRFFLSSNGGSLLHRVLYWPGQYNKCRQIFLGTSISPQPSSSLAMGCGMLQDCMITPFYCVEFMFAGVLQAIQSRQARPFQSVLVVVVLTAIRLVPPESSCFPLHRDHVQWPSLHLIPYLAQHSGVTGPTEAHARPVWVTALATRAGRQVMVVMRGMWRMGTTHLPPPHLLGCQAQPAAAAVAAVVAQA